MLKKNCLDNLLKSLFFFVFFFLVQCLPFGSSSSSSSKEQLSEGELYFRMSNSTPAERLKVIQLASDDKLEIYLDKALQEKFTVDIGNEILKKFRERISPIGDDYFGSPSDVDRNGKVTLLIVDLYQKHQDSGGGNSTYAIGFFNPLETIYDNSRGYNLKDLMFVDSHSYFQDNDNFYRTLIHEYQHLINWNERVLKSSKLGNVPLANLKQSLWLNEGLSVSSEHLYKNGFLQNYTNKFVFFKNLITIFQSKILGGDKFISWERSEQLTNYKTAYFFMQWLRVHAKSGHGIYKKLIQGEKGGVEGVIDLVKEEIPTFPKESSSLQWKDIFQAWNLAFYFNSITDKNSIYGYKKQVFLPGFVTDSQKKSLSLYPGESIIMSHYQQENPSFDISSLKKEGNFVYLSIKRNGSSLILNDSSQKNDYLLIMNKSANPDGSADATITLPNISQNVKIIGQIEETNMKKQTDQWIQTIHKNVYEGKIHSHGGETHRHISQEHWLKGIEKLDLKKIRNNRE